MAVTAEIVNIATHGQIGKKWIYFVREGVQYKRPYVIPLDPKTSAQRTKLNKFYMASRMWNKLTTGEKEEWKIKVEKSQYVMTAYNYFIRHKIKEIKSMIKQIISKTELLSDGLNVLVVAGVVDVDKSILLYNCFLCGVSSDPAKQYGIYRAVLSGPSEIKVHVRDPDALGDIRIRYQIIEYV